MSEPPWMAYEKDMPGLDASLDVEANEPDEPFDHPDDGQPPGPRLVDRILEMTPDPIVVARLEVIDEYEAITDPAFTEARFRPGGDLFHVVEAHRDLFRQPLLRGSRWECVTRARAVNAEREQLGKLATEGRVVVRQRTATYTAWGVLPEEEWSDAEVPL